MVTGAESFLESARLAGPAMGNPREGQISTKLLRPPVDNRRESAQFSKFRAIVSLQLMSVFYDKGHPKDPSTAFR